MHLPANLSPPANVRQSVLPSQEEDPEVGFVVLPPKAKVPTIYPVDLLQRVACAVAETGFGRAYHAELCDRIGRMPEEALDIDFMSLLCPLVTALHLAEEGEARQLYKKFKIDTYHPLYFKKFFKKTYFFDKGKRYMRLDLRKFQELADQIVVCQRDLLQFAVETAKARFSENQGLELDLLNAKKKEFRLKHQELRNLEAQLFLNLATVTEFGKKLEDSSSLWKTVGVIISFLALAILMPTAPYFALSGASSIGVWLGQLAQMSLQRAKDRFLQDRGPSNPNQIPIQDPQIGQVATYSYDTRSTGLWGALLRHPSNTEGILTLQGQTVVKTLRFHLEEGQLALQINNLDAIRTLMIRAIQLEQASPAQCIKTLQALSEMKIIRNGTQLPYGFIAKDALQRIFAPILCLYLLTDPEALKTVEQP